jgi:hypothetical protein
MFLNELYFSGIYWHTFVTNGHVSKYTTFLRRKVIRSGDKKVHLTTDEIPISERESTLWLASNQYMRGEISLKKLASIEENYALSPNIFTSRTRSEKALQKTSQSQYPQLFWSQLKKIVSSLFRKRY